MSHDHEKFTDGAVATPEQLAELQDSERLAARLEDLLEVVTALAELDFSRRAEIHGDGAFLDGIAYGLNVLSEELRASTVSRDYYDGIISAMAEGLLVVDAQGTVTDVNPASSLLLGYPHAHLVGVRWSAICRRPWAKLMAETASAEAAATTTAPLRPLETELLRADGSTVEVALSGSVLRGPNDVDGWMFVVQDISAHKEIARNLARARDAALHSAQVTASFLANMSHEIRTPLNGVIGMAWLLLDDASRSLDTTTRTRVETIHDCATLLLDIVNDILDLSKLESGSAELHVEGFDLAHTVENLMHVYAVRAEQKGLELISALEPALPGRLRGDAGRLRQVLGNLISNAVKFTDGGEVVVRVRALEPRADDRGGEAAGERVTLRFEVSDTGIGIAEHLQATIFEAFQQAETATARKYGGTGLGLTICKRLVALMGGRIGCHSRLGQGSTFWLELPLEPERGEPGATAFLGGRAVLVVEDNARRREALVRSIEHWGGQPLAVADEAEALARLSAVDEAPSLAIVDWRHPSAQGRRFLEQLAQRSQGRMRIVLSTSLASAPSVGDLRALGVIGGLPKPLKHRRLRSLLRGCVEGPDAGSERAQLPEVVPRAPVEPLLVVEDNAVNQAVLLGQLRRLGLTAQVARDGREAVAAVAKQRFSLVLMDLYMPGLDGYEATEQIRRLEHGVDLPIVAVTANATEQVRKRCLAVGMDDFLSKPLRIAQLSRCLSRWLVRRIEVLPEASETMEPTKAGRPAPTSAALEGTTDDAGSGTLAEPAAGARPAAATQPLASPPASPPSRASELACFSPDARVLIVDDNAINRRVLGGMLGRLGIPTDEVPSGSQALDAVALRRYGAVLMDVEMTGLDGLSATRMIREREPRRRTPILAVTGHDSREERERCLDAGMDDFLTKPVRMIELAARMFLWLGPAEPSEPRALVGSLTTGIPPQSSSIAALAERVGEPGLLAELQEILVRGGREALRRLARANELEPADARSRELDGAADRFVLITWAANLGALRLAALAAALADARPDERGSLMKLLDRELAALALS